jgi:DnaJ-class molecular chaperone
MMDKDYYRILAVPIKANGEKIKKAYREMAMRYHSDHKLGN